MKTLHETVGYRVTTAAQGCSTNELLAAVLSEPAAAALVTRFGSLHQIALASPDELNCVPGIGPAGVGRLRAMLEISRRLLAPEPDRVMINSPEDAFGILRPLLMHKEQEYLYVLLLDTRNRVMGAPQEIYHGSLNTSLIRTGEIFREAIRANAAAIIVAHNHPSGDPNPSPEDVAVTRGIVEAGKLLDIAVVDHLITGDGRFVSLKGKGHLG